MEAIRFQNESNSSLINSTENIAFVWPQQTHARCLIRVPGHHDSLSFQHIYTPTASEQPWRAGTKLISRKLHLCVPFLSHAQRRHRIFLCLNERNVTNRTTQSPSRPAKWVRPPAEATLARWPFPTTSRHLGGSHPCITVLLNQRLNVQVGCHNRGISKAHALLSEGNNAAIVWGHKCLFWFKSRFGWWVHI